MVFQSIQLLRPDRTRARSTEQPVVLQTSSETTSSPTGVLTARVAGAQAGQELVRSGAEVLRFDQSRAGPAQDAAGFEGQGSGAGPSSVVHTGVSARQGKAQETVGSLGPGGAAVHLNLLFGGAGVSPAEKAMGFRDAILFWLQLLFALDTAGRRVAGRSEDEDNFIVQYTQIMGTERVNPGSISA